MDCDLRAMAVAVAADRIVVAGNRTARNFDGRIVADRVFTLDGCLHSNPQVAGIDRAGAGIAAVLNLQAAAALYAKQVVVIRVCVELAAGRRRPGRRCHALAIQIEREAAGYIVRIAQRHVLKQGQGCGNRAGALIRRRQGLGEAVVRRRCTANRNGRYRLGQRVQIVGRIQLPVVAVWNCGIVRNTALDFHITQANILRILYGDRFCRSAGRKIEGRALNGCLNAQTRVVLRNGDGRALRGGAVAVGFIAVCRFAAREGTAGDIQFARTDFKRAFRAGDRAAGDVQRAAIREVDRAGTVSGH